MPVLFFITCAALPHFDRTSVLRPKSCNGFDSSLRQAPALACELPGTGTGAPEKNSRQNRNPGCIEIDDGCLSDPVPGPLIQRAPPTSRGRYESGRASPNKTPPDRSGACIPAIRKYPGPPTGIAP
ncbi:MAG: hypothetical protein WCH85_04030 [Methanomicrobiales archaeon]